MLAISVILGCWHHGDKEYVAVLPPPPQGCFTAFELPEVPKGCQFQGGVDALIDGLDDILRGCRVVHGKNIALVAGAGELDCWKGESCTYSISIQAGAAPVARGVSYVWDTEKYPPQMPPLKRCSVEYKGPALRSEIYEELD